MSERRPRSWRATLGWSAVALVAVAVASVAAMLWPAGRGEPVAECPAPTASGLAERAADSDALLRGTVEDVVHLAAGERVVVHVRKHRGETRAGGVTMPSFDSWGALVDNGDGTVSGLCRLARSRPVDRSILGS